MPTKLVVDCSTGVTTEVELTAEEIAQAEADAQAFAVAEAERIAAEEAKTRANKARDVYQAKKDEEERAKAGDLIGLHVNQ